MTSEPQDDPPIGKLFSRVYGLAGPPESDSKRMRHRLYACAPLDEIDSGRLADRISRNLGVEVPYQYAHDFKSFFERSDIRDILSTITMIFIMLSRPVYRGGLDIGWRDTVARIFREENVRYRVDELCGVHYLIDGEFERMSQSTLDALSGTRYRATKALFESALTHLDEKQPDTKGAIRGVFGAIEGLFRLRFVKAARLGTAEIEQYLRPVVSRHNASDKVAQAVGEKMVNTFKAWVEGAHFYRHEAGREEPTQPPEELAILLLSEGTSFLRWLAQIDRAID